MSRDHDAPPGADGVDRGRPALIGAWSAVAVMPALLLLGLLVSYALSGLFDVDTSGDKRSLAADLTGFVLTMALMTVPVVTAWRLGRRAQDHGLQHGLWPRFVAILLFLVVLALLVVQLVANSNQDLY